MLNTIRKMAFFFKIHDYDTILFDCNDTIHAWDTARFGCAILNFIFEKKGFPFMGIRFDASRVILSYSWKSLQNPQSTRSRARMPTAKMSLLSTQTFSPSRIFAFWEAQLPRNSATIVSTIKSATITV